MKRIPWVVLAGIGLTFGGELALGQAKSGTPRSVGPDITISDLFDLIYWGSTPVGSVQAYSVGTYACNIGNQPAEWDASSNQHPVIAQNIFRLQGGRFEQIGQSWVKWAFASENDNECGTCINPGTSSLLGVNCSDPYDAGLNGAQSLLGPKSLINPFTGAFPFDHPTPPNTTVGGRLQVHTTDVIPGLNPGALYFVEAQYISPDDSAAGNLYNNTSYRQVWIQPDLSLTFTSPQGPSSATVAQQPAIAAWSQQDASVFMASVDVPLDGRLYVARKATAIAGNNWHYELAIQNVNSDRSVGGLIVRLPAGASASNLGFHAVAYHSGEIYSSTPWTTAITTAGAGWNTVAYASDPNANALRWGTLYNFWFDADVPPPSVTLAELALFKPGTPTSLETPIGPVPALPGDTNCDGVVNFADINPFVQALSDPAGYADAHPGCPLSNSDVNNDGHVDFADINPFVALLGG